MSYECKASVNIDYAWILMTEDSEIRWKSVRKESQHCSLSLICLLHANHSGLFLEVLKHYMFTCPKILTYSNKGARYMSALDSEVYVNHSSQSYFHTPAILIDNEFILTTVG